MSKEVVSYDFSRMSIQMVLSLVERVSTHLAHLSEVEELETLEEYEEVIDSLVTVEHELKSVAAALRKGAKNENDKNL